MSILDRIKGKLVVTVGILGTAFASFLLGQPVDYIVTGLMLLVAALTYFGKVQRVFSKLLGGFADTPAWPRFVALGVASLLVAYHGGWHAVLAMIFLLAAMDGNVFDALY